MEKPMADIAIKASTTELIKEAPMIMEALKSPQNSHSTTIASTTARITVWYTSEIDSSIISLESLITVKWIPGYSASRLAISRITSSEVSMAVKLCCLRMPIEITSSPL